MRALIAIAIVVLILALVGWISFSFSDGRSSINLETEEIKQDTQKALESGSDLLKKVETELEETRSQADEPATDKNPDASNSDASNSIDDTSRTSAYQAAFAA